MDRDVVRDWLEKKALITYARSGGPGGQNVNKVNSKSLVRVSLRELPGVSEEERSYLIARLKKRLAAGDVLLVQAQDERSQSMNRALALERALAAIVQGLRRPKKRRPTRPSAGSKERRLSSKKLIARTKRSRGAVDEE
jgi:ribosome-associated protein